MVSGGAYSVEDTGHIFPVVLFVFYLYLYRRNHEEACRIHEEDSQEAHQEGNSHEKAVQAEVGVSSCNRHSPLLEDNHSPDNPWEGTVVACTHAQVADNRIHNEILAGDNDHTRHDKGGNLVEGRSREVGRARHDDENCLVGGQIGGVGQGH